jgi:hypothetical protein
VPACEARFFSKKRKVARWKPIGGRARLRFVG